jgi:hypothetical protein
VSEGGLPYGWPTRSRRVGVTPQRRAGAGFLGNWSAVPLLDPSAVVTVLLAGVVVFQSFRTAPSRILNRLKTVEDIARSATELCERFQRERLERKAEFDAFAERCEELLETATTKQRRAAASASRAARKEEGAPLTEEDLLTNLRRQAGMLS